MTVEEAIRKFVMENKKYQLYENYSGESMEDETCLGVVVKADESFMDFFIQLTQYFDYNGVDDVNCDLEGASYADFEGDIIVYFPCIKGT